MPKPKSGLLVRGALQRDVAALKRRVQALEKAVWPTNPASLRGKAPTRRLIEMDETAARRAAIEAFYKADRDAWLRKNPRILEGLRAERARLNKYLRDRGLEPEPDVDE